MQDISPVIIAACGLAIICVGLLALAAFVVVRFTGANILGPLMTLFSGQGKDDVADDYPARRPRPSTRQARPPASAQQASVRRPGSTNPDDFDAAVERYRQQGSRPSSRPQPGPRPSRPKGSALNRGNEPEARPGRDRSLDDDYEIYDDEEEGDIFGL